MWKKILILFFAVTAVNSLSAQKPSRKFEIKGTVMDVYNSPIANAIIMIDDQKTNSVTNSKGYYKVKVKNGASKISVFTFGNGTIEERIDGRNMINFSFKGMGAQLPPSQYGEQGVNTGYSTIKKKNLTTDITKIDGTDQKYSTYSSIFDMLQREVSGIRIDGNEVVIQDSQNFYGYVHPLVIVDGVAMSHVPDLPPVSIKSIEVLKATSAAIYGSRANGGAIVIRTKIQND